MCSAAVAAASNDEGFNPKCAMGISLGINMETNKCLYYAASPGAGHFTRIFRYFPLLCALKQVSLGRVPKESITRMASVKTAQGKTLTDLLSADAQAINHWRAFGKNISGSTRDLEKAIRQMKILTNSAAADASQEYINAPLTA